MKKNILLIDDDSDDRELFSLACSSSGASCTTLADGNSMLPTLDRGEIGRPDIIFLDVNMPQVNGWQCLTQLKKNEHYKNIPVIMYSTSGHLEEIEKAKTLGAICFFMKPDDFIVLQQGLSLVVEHLQSGKLDQLGQNSKLFI